MTTGRSAGALVLSLAVLLNCAPLAIACGPDPITPIFVFGDSPDPRFEEYVRGNLGILQPTMGRKTLFIGYRYVNGGSFTGEEQRALVEALRGTAPDDNGAEAIKVWIETRKEAGNKDEKLPAIYTERQYGGYDFFPNCTRSGFETATQTLKDRITTYGAEDLHVRAWLTAQDTVFQNCAGGSSIPQELGPDNPEWLRKDRDYQIGAAFFYSLNFDEARERFERIAADNNSPWRETADYLIARTLVRQASLKSDEQTKRVIYEQAERHLQLLLGNGGNFQVASQRLLALVDYRIHPEQRVVELGRILSYRNGNEDLRQDLIDYVWLLDKFDAQVMAEEQKRKKALKGDEDKDKEDYHPDAEMMARFEAVNKGELIQIFFFPAKPNGTADYEKLVNVYVKPDTSEAEIIELVSKALGRELTTDEITIVEGQRQEALENRLWQLAPNRKLSKIVDSQYEGNRYYGYDHEGLRLNLFPAFLRTDELSDWILTFQSTDPKAYSHAVTRWRETDSIGWLLAALAKSDRSSAQVERLLIHAEKVPHDSTAYPTIAYHLIRLKIAFGKQAEARKLLEDVLSSQSDLISVSARNQFLELGMQLAVSFSDFLRFGQRSPVAFYKFGTYGKISDILKIEKSFWDPEDTKLTKEEFEQKVDDRYRDLLVFDGQVAFDEKTADVFNTHLPLATLVEATRNPALSDLLQQRMLLAAWTRAVLLKNEKISWATATEIIKRAPHMKPIFEPYLDARTIREREQAALYILLRFPDLSPYIQAGASTFVSAEESDYYFETSWWCTPSDTEYDFNGNEIKKIVAKPRFLSPEQLETARQEHRALVAIGNAKSFLGKRVIAWAKQSTDDTHLPEALFIAAKANRSYKNGCWGWESDEGIVREADKILRNRYPDSPWTARLAPPEE